MTERTAPSADVLGEIAEINKQYSEDPRRNTLNFLLLGEMGSGKSFLARTARKPVLFDSFDPGGTKGLQPWIDKGEIIADTRWEKEKPLAPFAYDEWVRTMDYRVQIGLFDHIGTYILDSATTWSAAIMNRILEKAGRKGDSPKFTRDYEPQKRRIVNHIHEMLDLPCDFFLTGHLEPIDDPNIGIKFRFLTTGKGSIIIPTLFDEVWVMDPTDAANGVEYRILTQSTGVHLARSRLAKENLLDKYEVPNIKKILKKAGHAYEDLPLLETAVEDKDE
jgi:hypothetical protein